MITPYLHAALGIETLRRTREANRAIAREIDGAQPDVVLVKDCQTIMNPYVLRFVTTPAVFQCHHGLRHRLELERTNEASNVSVADRLRSWYYAPARSVYQHRFVQDEIKNIRSASSVLTNSVFSCELLAEHYGVTARAIYPGIDSKRFRPQAGPKGCYVLSVGALIYSKGYRFLVAALARIDRRWRPSLFIAANMVDADELRVVQELAARTEVELTVEQITQDERLIEVYSHALAFVYAPMGEALGMAPLEAMACGTPAVAVGEGGVRETVVDGVTGWLVERDPELFARKLESLLCDEGARRRMSEAGVEHVRSTWTWQRAVDELECALAAVRRP
jgi:glycosyltransferase involved in cell wall biosynthesis